MRKTKKEISSRDSALFQRTNWKFDTSNSIHVQQILIEEKYNQKVSMDIKNTIMPEKNCAFSVCHDLLDDYGGPGNEFPCASNKVYGIRDSSELCRKLLNPLIRHDPNCSDEFDPYVIVILSQLWKYLIHPIEAVFDYFGWCLTIKS